MNEYNNYDYSKMSDSELSKSIFDEQGVLYTGDYQILIKCPDKLNHIEIHPETKIIANYAFVGCRISNIILPKSLKIIGHHAFHYSSLEFIDIPDSVHTIGYKAFLSCQNLSRVSLPSKIKELQEGTFQRCNKLEIIHLPQSISSIGGGCFSGCFNIDMGIGNKDFNVFEDCLYQKSRKSLISCWSLKKNIRLPQGLLRIENDAFAACKHFNSIIISNTVVYIGNNLFGQCGVSDIYIPKSVEKIEPFAFDHNVKNIFVQIGQADRFKDMLPSRYHKFIKEI